jgi:hypothetical protein
MDRAPSESFCTLCARTDEELIALVNRFEHPGAREVLIRRYCETLERLITSLAR